MFKWFLDVCHQEEIEVLKAKLSASEKRSEYRRLELIRKDNFWYMMYKNETQLRQKLVRVYEEKKVKYNALQGRYQSKADRLVNLNKQLLKEAQNE